MKTEDLMRAGEQIIYYTLEGHNEVLQSPQWCLEGTVQEDKFRLGLGPYAEYKQLDDYEPQSPSHPAAVAAISAVRDSIKPAMVFKPTRSRKVKQKTDVVPSLQLVLDNTDPIDCVPQVLRDRFNGSIPTVPVSVPERDNV